MADYHILDINQKGDSARVVFHIAVPDENNAAGVNLRTAYKQWREHETGAALDSVVPWLSASNPTEYASVQSGAVAEVEEAVEFNANASNAAKQGVLDARYTSLSVSAVSRLQGQLKFWGMDRTVP